jgi:hypothetical protein
MNHPRAEGDERWDRFSLSPVAVEGEKAFARDLPRLLKERPGQWVAYHGERRLGFATTSTALYEQCLSEGVPEDDLVVHRIEPETPDEKIPPFEVDVVLSLRHLQKIRPRAE